QRAHAHGIAGIAERALQQPRVVVLPRYLPRIGRLGEQAAPTAERTGRECVPSERKAFALDRDAGAWVQYGSSDSAKEVPRLGAARQIREPLRLVEANYGAQPDIAAKAAPFLPANVRGLQAMGAQSELAQTLGQVVDHLVVLHEPGRGEQRDVSGLGHSGDRARPRGARIAGGDRSWVVPRHQCVERRGLGIAARNIGVAFTDPPTLAGEVEIIAESPWYLRLFAFARARSQRRAEAPGQAEAAVQFRACGEFELGSVGLDRERLGPRGQPLPSGARHEQREISEGTDIPDLWIPLAMIEHQAAAELRERARLETRAAAVRRCVRELRHCWPPTC